MVEKVIDKRRAMRQPSWLIGVVLMAAVLGACGGSEGPGEERTDGSASRADEATVAGAGTIAFSRSGDIYTVSVGDDDPTNLTDSRADGDTEPAWSPDGRRIAFTRWAAGEKQGDIS